MDERAAQALAVALCGHRLRRRGVARVAGWFALAAASILLALSFFLPLAPDTRGMILPALAGVAAAGLALLIHGSRFPEFGDAYRDLGLDPLDPNQLEQVRVLLSSYPHLVSDVTLLTAYDAPLRVRDLHNLRRLAGTSPRFVSSGSTPPGHLPWD